MDVIFGRYGRYRSAMEKALWTLCLAVFSFHFFSIRIYRSTSSCMPHARAFWDAAPFGTAESEGVVDWIFREYAWEL